MYFADQVVVITGASSGIGRALALELASQGAAVGLVARRRDLLETLASEIRQRGGKAAVAVANVAERTQTVSAIHALRDQLGPVDLLVANSGIGVGTPLEPLDIELVEKVFQVNTLGVVYAIEAVLPDMLKRGKGHLAATSSLASYKGFPGESAYCASKAAVNFYMEGLRIQLRSRGIHVTTICPGFIRTPMTAVNQFPMPGLMDADKAAQRIATALRKRRKVFNFPLRTAILMKMAAWAPDWFLAWMLKGQTGDRPRPPE